MAEYFYSAEFNIIYPESLREGYEKSPDGWPRNLVALTNDKYAELISGKNNGLRIIPDKNGNPVLVSPPPLTHDEMVEIAELARLQRLTLAAEIIAPLQDAADLNIATVTEMALLTEWKKYRVLLNRIDTSTAPDIEWPEAPGDVA